MSGVQITDWQIVIDQNAVNSLSGSAGVVAALEGLAQAGEAVAKSHAPVDTGNLRRSITHEVFPGRNPSARVGTNVRYGIFQELGTRFHAAQPFMRPAMEAVKRLVKG
jgi:Bacteriophage protein of unknown function (DUF646).